MIDNDVSSSLMFKFRFPFLLSLAVPKLDSGLIHFNMTEAAIVKKLCAQNGSISYDALISMFGLFDHEAVDSLVGRSESFAVAFVNGQKKVIARTKVRLCRVQNCPGCSNLHLCKWFLFGSCRFDRGRRGCRFSHDLLSGQNALVLTAHGLNTLDEKELCILLMQSDNTLLPAVCHSYNNGTGEYGRCPDAENCKRLHICEKYLRGSCDCTRAHDFYEPHPLKTLQDRGVPAELMAIMKDLYSNIEVLRRLSKAPSAPNAAGPNPRRGPNAQNRRPSSGFNAVRGQGAQRPPQNNTEKTEICMYFVKGHCKHGGSCWKEHSTLPYKWEVKEGSEWKALPDNEAIEKDYCDAARTYSSGMNMVYFDTMTQGCYSVRRLSTVPSVLQPTFILTTEWIWYWEDEYGNWIQYATADGGHGLSSISSAELEQKFQADSNAVVEFTAGSQTYELSFTDMIQTNKRYTTKKVVRRRPKFVSAADVRTIKTTKRTPNNFKALPEHWDKALTPETGYKSVSLQSTSAEHIKIKELFSRTMVGFRILKIERIQNKALWEVYQWQKDFMKKNNGGRDVTEKQLFHGTDSTHLDAICHNNFDWRICGTHGTAYGKGSYFARDAKYSHSYTKDAGTRSMFVCRILVGSYTKGESSYLRPPSKDGGDTVFYDSCVNDVFDPSVFVVFEKHQIYPEYLIEYRDVGGFDSPSRPAVANPAVAVRSRVAVPAVTRHIPSTNASSSYSSSSNNPFYKPSSAASSSYTASYISSSSASSSRVSPSRSFSSHASTPPKSSKSECIIS
ncbi:poly [ADP-ribose] polymerase 12 isoform X1 [Sinocyclocheilus anshuiensis]|uniref:Poly [ADP-ribose] polymerase 12-like n=2 Tax=Sinocyclocheilus anshuiensis TaxID=1608454 RepID=A0A671SGB9_9TELE|nr:PREDICTED: poly [ADP-ribose] polymerase 12-like isoform X1 [Sinocyclocheilus anshuiensis]